MARTRPSPQAPGEIIGPSLDKAAAASYRRSLLEGAAWVALGVPDAAAGDGGLPGLSAEACWYYDVVMRAAA